MLRHYTLGDEWADAIEGFEGLFDELGIKKRLGEEKRLDLLALITLDWRIDNTILNYGGAIATNMCLISVSMRRSSKSVVVSTR
jgi:hypothetical protein